MPSESSKRPHSPDALVETTNLNASKTLQLSAETTMGHGTRSSGQSRRGLFRSAPLQAPMAEGRPNSMPEDCIERRRGSIIERCARRLTHWGLASTPPEGMGVFPPASSLRNQTRRQHNHQQTPSSLLHRLPLHIWLQITESADHNVAVEIERNGWSLSNWMDRLKSFSCLVEACWDCEEERHAWEKAFYSRSTFIFHVRSYAVVRRGQGSPGTSARERLHKWLNEIGDHVGQVSRLRFRHHLFLVHAHMTGVLHRRTVHLELKPPPSRIRGQCHLDAGRQALFEKIAKRMLENAASTFGAVPSKCCPRCRMEELVKSVCKVLIMHNMIWCEEITTDVKLFQAPAYVPSNREMYEFAKGPVTNLPEDAKDEWSFD